MLVIGDDLNIYPVDPMPQTKEDKIKSHLLGSVYSWCNNNDDAWFNTRNFVANNNKDWSNTPLIYLYTRRISSGMTDAEAHKEARLDLGKILKSVVHDDVRYYETKIIKGQRNYRWLMNYDPSVGSI